MSVRGEGDYAVAISENRDRKIQHEGRVFTFFIGSLELLMKLLDSTIRRAEREGGGGGQKHWPRKRVAREIVKAAFIYFDSFHTPFISTATGCCCKIIHLVPDRPCTIGRSHQSCDYVLEDRRVSKQHCQILFDGFHRKIFILDGGRFRTKGDLDKLEETAVRPSLNGIFLNGFKIGKDTLKELSAGDEVSFVCQNERLAGFLIQRIVFTEEALEGRGEAASSAPFNPSPTSESDDLITRRANFYLGQCRCILNSDDPISYIRGFVTSYSEIQGLCSCSSRLNNFPSFLLSTDAKLSPVLKGIPWPSQGLQNVESSENIRANRLQLNSIFLNRQSVLVSELNPSPTCVPVPRYQLYQLDHAGFPHADVIASAKPKTLSSNSMGKENDQQFHGVMHNKTWGTSCPPPGKKFYLNRLEFMNYSSSGFYHIARFLDICLSQLHVITLKDVGVQVLTKGHMCLTLIIQTWSLCILLFLRPLPLVETARN